MEALGVRGGLLLVLLSLQFAVQPFLTRSCVASDVHLETIVLATEVLKLTIAMLVLVTTGSFSSCLKSWSPMTSLRDAGRPALVYAVQNQLLQLAYQHLDGLTFNLVNQTKTIFTALMLFFLMGRKQSTGQIIALCAIFAVSLFLATEKPSAAGGGGGDDDSSASTAADAAAAARRSRAAFFELGIVPLLGASLLSGVASALSQLTLQGRRRNSYFFTVELSIYSSLSILLGMATFGHTRGMDILRTGVFRGWTMYTFAPVLSSALGGILVGLVMKYAGGVRKGFAIVAGILLTGVIEAMAEGRLPSTLTMACLPVVLLATLAHIQFPASSSSSTVTGAISSGSGGEKSKKE